MRWTMLTAMALTVTVALPARGDGGITYDDIVAGDAAGVTYRRVPSARNDIFEAIKQQPTYEFDDVLVTPLKPRGAPGVALFDYDNDGDLDIYVTNGPGAANSLYANQLEESGVVTFLDVGVASGSDLTAQDSNGVCAGDIDNDGDQDLYVLGAMEANRLLENQGDGSFLDITDSSQTAAGAYGAASCSMGDIDGDGLLDIFIGNTFDLSEQFAIFAIPFDQNHPNQLLQNQGGNVFVDVSAESGILETTGFDPPADGAATISWAVMLMDYDRDGDIDIVQGDDQAAVPFEASNRPGAVDRGMIHVFTNDGTGAFVDRTIELDLDDSPGQWMGLSAGDVNCDGHMDIFGSNFGDYTALILEPTYPYGLSTSRFFYGLSDGTFADPRNKRVGGASVFGWGTSMLDYDNDGDLDIIFHGGLDLGPYVEATNPGVMLQNTGQCSGLFTFDADATSSTDHLRRTVHGSAIGDLDQDGFDDIVSVSAFDFPEPIPVVPFGADRNSVFDVSGFVPVFAPTAEPQVFVFTGITMPDGTLSVELASGDNGNGSAQIRTLGGVGMVSGASVNRDGVGAHVTMRPDDLPAVTRPVLAGSSYASTDSKRLTFGMGQSDHGVVEVLWPGGVRNRLYGVSAGEVVTFPEIPCSFDADWGWAAYANCVSQALGGYVAQGVISPQTKARFFNSALIAFQAGGDDDDDDDDDVSDDIPDKCKHLSGWLRKKCKKKFGWWNGHWGGLGNLPDPIGADDFLDAPEARVELGKQLFFDKILSGNENISCATCHHPLNHTGDGLSVSVGEGGRGLSIFRDTGTGDDVIDERVPRNAQQLFNIGALEYTTLFHDGRVAIDPAQSTGFEEPTDYQLPDGLDSVLAVQAMFPVTSPEEMAGDFDEGPVGFAASWNLLAGPDGVWELLAARLRAIPEYVALFQQAFDDVFSADDITFVHAANAMAAYQTEAFKSINSPFDRFLGGDWRALSPAQIRGMKVFYGKARCGTCHSGPLQTDHQFYAIAMPQIGPGKSDNGPSDHDDFGLANTTGDPYDRYKFRVPSLRNVALTAPYGHAGAYADLAGVVAHHLDPEASLLNYDPSQALLPALEGAEDTVVTDDPDVLAALIAANELTPVDLYPSEFEDLLDFLHALTDPAMLDLRSTAPTSVPSGLPLYD